MRIDILDVLLPISMISIICLFGDRRYPNSINSKTLDVVQFANDPLKCSPTVFTQDRAWRGVISVLGKSICEDLER